MVVSGFGLGLGLDLTLTLTLALALDQANVSSPEQARTIHNRLQATFVAPHVDKGEHLGRSCAHLH